LSVCRLTAQHATATIAVRRLDQGEMCLLFFCSRISLEEKTGEMRQLLLNLLNHILSDVFANEGKVSSSLFIANAAEIDRLQHPAIEKSRLPDAVSLSLWVIHGFRRIYPVRIALAVS